MPKVSELQSTPALASGDLVYVVADGVSSKLASLRVANIAAMVAIAAPINGMSVEVTEEGRGGLFVYDSAQAAVNNGGTVFNGWVRRSTNSAERITIATPEMFDSTGILNDPGADHTPVIQAAIDYLASLPASGLGGRGILQLAGRTYNVTGLTFPFTNFFGVRGEGQYLTFLQLIGTTPTGIAATSRGVFEGFSVVGLGGKSTAGDIGVRVTAAQSVFRNVRAMNCEVGWLIQDAYINSFYECHGEGCLNGLVMNGTQDIGYGTGSTKCQDNRFFGGSFNKNTWAVRLAGTRRSSFVGTNIELNTYGFSFEGSAPIAIKIDGCWIENAFYPFVFDLVAAGSLALNNVIENCYVAGFNASDYLPAGKALADSRYVYVQSAGNGLRFTRFRSNFFTTVAGGTPAHFMECVDTPQRTYMDGNYSVVTTTLGNVSNIVGENGDSVFGSNGFAILQTGGNTATGFYVRFGDGTQICSIPRAMDQVITAGATAEVEWTFPVPFSEPPAVSMYAATTTLGEDIVLRTIIGGAPISPGETAVTISARNAAGGSRTARVSVMAIGRWDAPAF